MMRGYKTIQLPLEKDVHETTEKEAEEFFKWFMNVIPERLKILKEVLKETGYEPKRLDFSPKSLDYLGEWLTRHVTTRSLTQEEVKSFKTKYSGYIKKGGLEIPLSKIVQVPKWVFTDETLSFCWDVGIYFSKVLEKNVKGLKWNFVKKPKNDAYYHYPVLLGFDKNNKVGLSPKDVIEVFVTKSIKKNGNPEKLTRLFEIWKYDAEHPEGPFWWEEFTKKDWRKNK